MLLPNRVRLEAIAPPDQPCIPASATRICDAVTGENINLPITGVKFEVKPGELGHIVTFDLHVEGSLILEGGATWKMEAADLARIAFDMGFKLEPRDD